MKALFSSLTLILLVLSGCGSAPAPKRVKVEKPAWINNSAGAIGICDTHIDGNAKQEEVAIDRALEKLAKQEAVNVKTNSTSTQRENSGVYNSGYQSQTNIKANARVKASIKKSWRNPSTNRYYVWMVKD